jgi:DNA-binding NarL/FixJ family response regulator/anti-sigma regulatory factor (Ser/Thr protein kinase)
MILLADDSELHRNFILEVLKKEPLDWLIETVSSAEEAIALMRHMAFDVIITDVVMSGMSGLELVNQVHRQPKRVPIIVISGEDDPTAAIEALKRGAASYVAKKDLSARLGETVRQVLDASRLEQNYQNLIGCAEEMRFKFSLKNDPDLVQPLVGLVQRMSDGMNLLSSASRTRIGVAIDEALVNAICHGNLELSEEEMREVHGHLHSGTPSNAIESRRTKSPFCERQVHVSLGISLEGIKVVVRDDGSGFSRDAISSSNEHRGITLIQNLVDKASYNETGNEITLVKFRDQKTQSTQPQALQRART